MPRREPASFALIPIGCMTDPYRTRAERFTIDIPVSFRVTGEEQWQKGQIVNLSESGLLFDSHTPLEPQTPLELLFSPPIQVGPIAPGKVICVGEVVRTSEGPVVGARFEECRVVQERPGQP